VNQKLSLKRDRIRTVTDIAGAETLDVNQGIANITIADKERRLHVPFLKIADGAKMVARVHLHRERNDKRGGFIHVAQHSGGQLIGGVSLELRPKRK
jgi:hypothetical protein